MGLGFQIDGDQNKGTVVVFREMETMFADPCVNTYSTFALWVLQITQKVLVPVWLGVKEYTHEQQCLS